MAEIKPPNTPAKMKAKAKIEETEKPEWPPSSFSSQMKDLVKEFEDVLVENLNNQKQLIVSH